MNSFLPDQKPPWQLSQRALGFTIIELLVSVAILALLATLTLEILSQTTRATQKSTAQLETSSDARVVLDRINQDISAAIVGPSASILYGSSGSNSTLGFLSQTRARLTTDTALAENLRGSAIGYKVRSFSSPGGGSVNLLGRGDGRLTFWKEDASQRARYNLADFFQASGLPAALASSAGSDDTLLEWTPSGVGVVRFHVSFLLNDGTIVQTPPGYKDFGRPQGGSSLDTGACIPIAFSPLVSDDASQRFVKALIVSLAVLDDQARMRAEKGNILSALTGTLANPADGQTAVQFWSSKLPDLPDSLRQSVRFFEKTISIN